MTRGNLHTHTTYCDGNFTPEEIVKMAIEKHHNGKVFVKSELGKGATFGFVIPTIQQEIKVS